MVEQIGTHAQLPDDFGADLNGPVLEQVSGYIDDKANSLSELKTSFESKFSSSPPLVHKAFQQFLYGAVDHFTSNIRDYLDQNAHAHSLLPQDIDHLLSQAQGHLKGHATIAIPSPAKTSKYRGNKLAQATQAKTGVATPNIADTANVAATPPPPTLKSGGGEGGLSNQLKQMLAHMFDGNSPFGESHAQQEKAQAKAIQLSKEELDITNLCAEFFATSNPLEKGDIYQELSLAIQGQLPTQTPKKPSHKEPPTHPEGA